jgi:hypothetical protein
MHQSRLSFLRKTTPSCTRDLGILHLLFEHCAKCFEPRFKKPDVATHYAEMGNLLPLDPKIHSLWTHTKKLGSVSNSQRNLILACAILVVEAHNLIPYC